MAINYFINKSVLNDKAQYTGRVSLKDSCGRETVIKRMLDMGTTVSEEDIEGTLSLFEKAVYAICLEGNKVNLDGFMQFTPAVSGTFEGERDSFDKSKNDVYMTAQVSSAYNRRFKAEASVEKVAAAEKRPYIMEISDNNTGNVNTVVSQNNIVTLYGEQMKFDSADADENLRFVNAGDVSQSAVIPRFQKITDKEIVFLMPAVAYASGYFEIASKMGTSTVRTGKSVTVEVG